MRNRDLNSLNDFILLIENFSVVTLITKNGSYPNIFIGVFKFDVAKNWEDFLD
jgi:hypothetical protein